MVAPAAFALACRPPAQEARNIPPAGLETGRSALETRLSFWGVGIARDGPAGGAASRFDGSLSQLGGCLIVTAANGIRLQPVFPEGQASWDATTGTLTYGGRDYRAGDQITLGGGGASPALLAGEPGVRIAECGVADLFIVAG